MVPHPSEQSFHADDRVAALINEYFDRRREGESLTPESFAAEHPELSGELLPYLEGLGLLDQIRSDAQLQADELQPGGKRVAGANVPKTNRRITATNKGPLAVFILLDILDIVILLWSGFCFDKATENIQTRGPRSILQ